MGSVFRATVSYTVGDAQQVIVPQAKKKMEYSDPRPIKEFLKWLGKPKFGG